MLAGDVKTTGTLGFYGTVYSRLFSVSTLGFWIGNSVTLDLIDSVSLSDTALIGNFLSFVDSFSLADDIDDLVLDISVGDTIFLSDTMVSVLEQYLSDSVSISDNIETLSSIAFGDAIVIADGYSTIASGTKGYTIVDRLYDPDAYRKPWMGYIAIGESNEGAGAGTFDTLGSELHRKAGEVFVRENSYFIRARFGQDEPTEDDLEIYEIGLFDASSGGNMYKRWILDTPITKDNIDEIIIELSVTIKQG